MAGVAILTGGSTGKGLKAQLFVLIRQLLNQEMRSALKKRIVRARKTLAPAYLFIYGRYSAQIIVDEIAKRIPKDAEIVMIHSSYDRLLPMYTGTALELVQELISRFGTGRTLVMPTFVLGGRSYDKCRYFSTHVFDVRRTPSEAGLLTEVFRRMPGVTRSLHPTHSVCAFGPLASALTATHHLSQTRAGVHTPFEMMAHYKTAIVGLGVEYYRCLAQTHTAEDLMGDSFPVKFERKPIPTVLIDVRGNRTNYELVIPQSSKKVDNTVLRSLLSRDELTEWRFRGTAMFVTMARAVTERLISAAQLGTTVYR